MDSELHMTLAQKVVIVDRGGHRSTQGLSLVLPVCDLCGAVLADQQRHDEWHKNLRTSLEIVADVLERMDKEAPDGQ